MTPGSHANRDRGIALLADLTEAHGAPGNEGAVREIFARELAPHGKLGTDRAGSVLCTRSDAEGLPTVLLAGHMDEVGFMVQNISLEGFVQFVPLGGWWSHSVLSQRLRILTRSGTEVIGVTTSLPPHFLSDAEKDAVVPLERMFIDVGATSREDAAIRLGIRLGDTIVPDSPFTPLTGSDDLFMAKAFDNRAGMALAIHATQSLAGRPLPCQLVTAGTVQEEVGTRGAQTLAALVQPDLALVLEGPPADDTPGFNRADSQGALGGGVQIRVMDPTALMNRSLVELVVGTAEDHSITHQVTVRRSGGTDARTFALQGTGVPCVVIGVPARYIHSHNSILHMGDYLAALELLEALIPKLNADAVGALSRYL
ncbi:M42 family metallopeptidase [soil metagenome]